MIKSIKSLFNLSIVFLVTSSIALSNELLPKDVANILRKHGIPATQVGVYISWIDGTPIAMHNIDKAFNPASSIKLITSMAALDILGANHTWESAFYAAAPIVDGNLRGDLYFYGQGDPFFTNEKLHYLIAGLKKRGINYVAGDLVIDNSKFIVAKHDPADFDGQSTKPYNAAASSTAVNFGASEVIINANNGHLTVFIEPDSSTFTIINKLKYRKAACTPSWRRLINESLSRSTDGRAQLELTGYYASGCGEKNFYLLAQTNPLAHLAGSIKQQYKSFGGEILGDWRIEKTPVNAKLLHSQESQTLAEVIRGMNKYSNNFMARNIFYSLAYDEEDEMKEITLDDSRNKLNDWFVTQEINTENMYVDNGSGLSRTTKITPKQFGQALLNFKKNSYFNELVASLAILGVDGTTRTWNRNTDVAGNAHLKTGTLNNARSTTGIVHNPNDDIVFVVLTETRGTGAARRAIQDLLNWSYNLAK